jgi:type VI secretion system protein ImpH
VSWTDDLAAEPWRFDLIATLRRLEREAPEKPRVGEARRLGDEVVRISQPPFLAFPAANVVGFTRAEGKPPRLDAQFLGLFGPQGPLPLEATEEAHDWGKRREDAIFTRFADLVQGRFLELFFRAWGQSRPIAHNDRPDDDRFRVYLGALIGLGTPTLRDADGLDEFTKMSFAGLMSPRVKSTARLRGLLQGLIDGPVEIDEFVGAWLPLEAADRSRLGAVNSGLGTDLMLGSRVFSVSDKFRIRVFTRDLAHYREFLPGGARARDIADAVYLYLGFEFDWDLELAIPAGKVAATRLDGGARLGWTSWMAPKWAEDDRAWLTDAHFDVAGRLAQEREARRGA